jgi:hypothetical protein
MTTDMDCDEDYLEINGVKKCGGISFTPEDFMNVELVEAGESVEFHLKNTSPLVSIMIFIYTGAEPNSVGPGSRSYSDNVVNLLQEK